MKQRCILMLLAATMLFTTAAAQRRTAKSARNAVADTAQVVRDYKDSLVALRLQLDSVRRQNDSLRSESSDGRYYRLFAPTTFYHSSARRALSLSPAENTDGVAEAVDRALLNLYMHRPDLVTQNETRLKEVGSLRNDVNEEIAPEVKLADLAAPAPEEPQAVIPQGLVVTRPNFWKFKGEGYLQFLQNYVSNNWHKGGESNYSAVGAATLELNYNDKDRVTFDNKLEMKLGVQTSRTDSIHKFKTNNDLLRFTSKLGLQAHKKWYYTLQLLAYTQFAPGLKANDKMTYSDFMSPFDLNIGIGMEYKLEAFNKRLTGTLNLLPLSFNFRYVDREALIPRNGMRGDHHTMEDFGSQFTGELKWNIVDQLTWKSRLFLYTSYDRALMEWENQFELKVTKYISANLFVYPRFDDSNTRDEDMGYFQFQEWSSIGLTYTF